MSGDIRIMVSMVADATSTETTHISFDSLRVAIKHGRWKPEVEEIRRRYQDTLRKTASHEKAKRAVDALKKKLPGVLPSGTFSRRDSESIERHSGLLCSDIDNLNSAKDEVRRKLSTSPYLFFMHESPTGEGLKAFFSVAPDASKHAASFRALRQHVRELTGVEVDTSARDLARISFVSWDPCPYYNPQPKQIEPLPEPDKPQRPVNNNIDLSARQRISSEMLGRIEWISETSGFFVCPGKHLHTAGDNDRDCKIDLDNVPTLHCFHNHCRGILDGINKELRSRIGKAEFHGKQSAEPITEVKTVEKNFGDVDEPGIELPPAPAPYLPPPLDLLPIVLRDYVQASAACLDVSESYIFQPLLSALAAHIGNSRSILLKPGYVEPPVIWTGIIGPSGSLKSPAIASGCLASMELERELRRQNKEANERYEDQIADWEITNKKLRGSKPEKPGLGRHVTDDLTIEVLADLLTANPRGLLIRKDELSQWFASFDQYRSGKGSDVGRWLSLHTGVFFAVDRRSDNRHYTIFDPRVSINGGIQPKTLRRVLTEDFFERGLPARFLFDYPPPDRPHQWTEATVPEKLIAEVLQLFERLWLLTPRQDNSHAIPEEVTLTPEAKEIFVAFYNATFRTARVSDEREEAAWAKLPGQSARLALVGQLAHDADATAISGEVMQAACKLAGRFGHEAARIYSELSETEPVRERRELVEFIQKRGGSVTVRDTMQSFWRLKNDRAGAERQLYALVKDGLAKTSESKPAKGGWKTVIFQLLRLSTSTLDSRNTNEKPPPSVDVDAPNSEKLLEKVRGVFPAAKLI